MESLLRTLMDNQPAFEGHKDEIKSLRRIFNRIYYSICL